MATKPKDNSSGSSSNSSTRNSKKLGTVSSNSQIPTYKQSISPKPNPISPKPTSVSSSKSVPNYLKPTVSSRSESLKLGNSKKSLINNSEDASKEKLLRRRSFDRPPSASRGSKSLISPDRKERLGSRDKPSPLATRASSFSGSRTQISGSKLAAVKSFKPVKSLAAAETNVNRSSSFSRTKNPTTKDASRSLKPHNVEIKQDKVEESLILQDVEEVKTPKDEKKEEEENEDKELHLDNIDLDVKDDEEDDLSNPKEISTIITLEEENFLQQTHVEDLGSEIEFLQGDREEEEEKEELHPICSEYNNNNDIPELEPEPEEGIVVKNILVDDAKVESDHEAKEEEKNSNENADFSEEIVEEKNERSEIEIKAKEGEEHEVEIGVAEEIELEKEEEVEKGKEEHEEEEEEEEEKEGKKEERSDNSNEVQKSTEGGQENNKKETPTAYNDVIEETKNKLLQKRKNKVKALVGAFETVIDYETAGSK